MSNGELLARAGAPSRSVGPRVPVCLCSVLYAGLLKYTSVERHLIYYGLFH